MKRNVTDPFLDHHDEESTAEIHPLVDCKDGKSFSVAQQAHKRRLWFILSVAFVAGLMVDHVLIAPASKKDPIENKALSYQQESGSINENKMSCSWSPDDQLECLDVLSSRLPFHREGAKRIGQRWLFFGDSTVMRLVRRTNLGSYLLKDAKHRITEACGNKYSFRHELAERCHYNQVYDMQYRRNMEWSAPDYLANGEGPASFGAENPYCTDCSGCQTEFLVSTDERPKKSCDIRDDEPVSYGGYFGVEFARDVEMQSPEFHTTQENVAAFLSRTYNTKSNVEAWGKPVCVVCFGHHDAAIPNITQPLFEKNARWYLELLEPQCDHIVFLANTAPATEKYPQKFKETRDWNHAVKDILETTPRFRDKATYFDPFEASAVSEHVDNVHMTEDWYDTLGEFFLAVIQQ